MKQDINEKERDRLFHQIVQLEHEEDELRNLKKRREQSLENFIEQFRNISINAEQGYLGWSDDLIKLGAGKAQHISDLFKVDKYYIVGADIKYDLSLLMGQYGDNEGDAAAIQDGMDDYKKGNN